MITLYGIPRSRSLRVSWLLEELQLDWSYKFINFSQGENRAPDFLAISPEGKVPALQDGDLHLNESAAICLYLAEKYGQGKWLPASGSADSARHHQWVSFIISELEQALWSIGKHKFALPKEQRIPEMLATAQWEFNKAATTASGRLPSSTYLFGESPQVADVLLCHTLNWAVKFEQVLPENLETYRQTMSARSAMKKALEKEQSHS
ncbi:glutathione S-transferase family protein [Vibrio sp. Of7-15]|uniref:glutathione S-transferase family protein n=1 Tax=Vibrio sp. Of7-15 TaxID=2724879 RepID=UPI001EF34BF7|nr:glutathione S-transferase family protein [Vibrio sp. Of7-15]MCG7500204.1 glutathione S-transferase family protein [Vibrio sp. Of7-15]